MNADEIVRALKLCAGDRCCEGCIEEQSVRHWQIVMREAAGLIESLRAEVDESQRREQAAVEDIMCRDHCDVCVSGKEHGGECKKADYDCLSCKSETCMCRDCRDEDRWQWRGPQEAGEDGRDG